MGKITDPTNLNQNVEVTFLTGSDLRVRLNKAGNLNDDGVTLQALYSFAKEVWRNDANLIKYEFPFVAITEKKFDVINEWDWFDTASKELVRDAGWALKNSSNVSIQEYMGFVSLGALTTGDQVYYQQSASGASSDIVLTGSANQAVKIYESGVFDYRGYFKNFIRTQGKTYAQSQLEDIGESTVTYQVYAFPLANATDTKIDATDNEITGTYPYISMSIWYYTGSAPVYRTIGAGAYPFTTIISGSSGSIQEIYEFAQYKLRQNSNINSNDTTPVVGKTADALLSFVGDTLVTEDGVFIDGLNTTDINSVQFYDTGSVLHEYPFVAAGNITFNANLTADPSGTYKMFFTSVPSGAFGSASALLVNNADGNPITGSTFGQSSVAFTFDYDNNTQGGRTAQQDAAVSIVAIGLDTAQYVTAVGTIGRSNANAFSVVSSLERNYNNPV